MASRGTVEVQIWDLNPGIISFRLTFNHLTHKPLQWVWEWLALALPAKSFQSCLTLWDPMDCSLQGSSVHGILQTRILEWVAMPSYRDLPNPGLRLTSLTCPASAEQFFTTNTTSLAQMSVWQDEVRKDPPPENPDVKEESGLLVSAPGPQRPYYSYKDQGEYQTLTGISCSSVRCMKEWMVSTDTLPSWKNKG